MKRQTPCQPYLPPTPAGVVYVKDIIDRLDRHEKDSMIARFAGANPRAFEVALQHFWEIRAGAAQLQARAVSIPQKGQP